MRNTCEYVFFVVVATSSVVTALWGQQVPQFSQYMLNPVVFNAAAAGAEDRLVLSGTYRKQWAGLAGSPTSQHINVHLPVYRFSSGAGVVLENDVVGLQRITSAQLLYNYVLPMGGNSQLRVGAGGGALQLSLDGTRLRAPEGEYGGTAPIHNDPDLPDNLTGTLAGTLQAGVWLQTPTLQTGLSVQHLNQPKVEVATTNNTAIELKRNYFFTFAARLLLGERWQIQPSVLVKSDLSLTQLDVTVLAVYANRVLVGSGWRGYGSSTLDAAVLLAGVYVTPQLQLLYSYDLGLSSLRAYHNGSHELTLRYRAAQPIGKGVPPPVFYNPRFL